MSKTKVAARHSGPWNRKACTLVGNVFVFQLNSNSNFESHHGSTPTLCIVQSVKKKSETLFLTFSFIPDRLTLVQSVVSFLPGMDLERFWGA
jgi:hypothetical protein